jgi:hypothetical protein
MKTRRFVAVVLAASILAVALPETARAGEPTTRPAQSVDLRAAIDRAATQLAAQPATAPAKQHSSSSAGQAAYGGGGGGKGMLIVTLVTTVVGLGATYYMLKEMQKQTDQAGKQ